MSTPVILQSKASGVKPILTDNDGNTLTGDQLTFTEAPQCRTAIRLIPRSTPPTDVYATKEGSIYYDAEDKVFYYYDGSAWSPLVVPYSGTPLYTPSVNNTLVRFNGTGGNIKGSVVTLTDIGNMAGLSSLESTNITSTAIGTQNLTCTTGLLTPSINSPGTGVTFNNKNITNVASLTVTSMLANTSINTPLITSSGGNVSFGTNNITNAGSISGTSVQTPSISGVTSISPGGGLLDMNNAQVYGISTLSADNVASNGGDLNFFSGTGIADFGGLQLQDVNRIKLQFSNATDIPLELLRFAETLPRLSLDGDGFLKFTDGSSTIFGSQGFLGKAASGALTLGFTKGAGDGTLFLKTLSGPGADGMFLQNSSGAITLTGTAINADNLVSTTNISAPGFTTSGSSFTFNNKGFTSVGSISATTATFSSLIKQRFNSGDFYQPIVFYNRGPLTANSDGTTNQVFWTATLGASSLATDYDRINIVVEGNANGSTATRNIGVNFFTRTATVPLKSGSGSMWRVEMNLVRTGSASSNGTLTMSHDNLLQTNGWRALSNGSFSSGGTISLTMTSGAANEITVGSVTVVFYPSQT